MRHFGHFHNLSIIMFGMLECLIFQRIKTQKLVPGLPSIAFFSCSTLFWQEEKSTWFWIRDFSCIELLARGRRIKKHQAPSQNTSRLQNHLTTQSYFNGTIFSETDRSTPGRSALLDDGPRLQKCSIRKWYLEDLVWAMLTNLLRIRSVPLAALYSGESSKQLQIALVFSHYSVAQHRVDLK